MRFARSYRRNQVQSVSPALDIRHETSAHVSRTAVGGSDHRVIENIRRVRNRDALVESGAFGTGGDGHGAREEGGGSSEGVHRHGTNCEQWTLPWAESNWIRVDLYERLDWAESLRRLSQTRKRRAERFHKITPAERQPELLPPVNPGGRAGDMGELRKLDPFGG